MRGYGKNPRRERTRGRGRAPRRGLELVAGVGLTLAATMGLPGSATAAPGATAGESYMGAAAVVAWQAPAPQAPGQARPAAAADARQEPVNGGARAGSAVAAGEPSANPGGRGFSHTRHRNVSCGSCHLSAQSHGALKVQTHEDCQACHHAAAQRVACGSCHRPGELPRAGAVSVPVRTTVDAAGEHRVLPFSHEYHGAVACASCHGAPPAMAPVKTCTTCHEQHHTAARDCQRCHRPEDVKHHPSATVHAGCSGGGCHSDRAVVALTWSRSVCLSCHQDRARHAVGGDCAACHQVPALQSARKEVGP